MKSLLKVARDCTNAMLGGPSARAQIFLDREYIWWQDQQQFHLGGKAYPLFVHRHNCGWPTSRMTERAVELALTDAWLAEHAAADVIEIGAVNPTTGRIESRRSSTPATTTRS